METLSWANGRGGGNTTTITLMMDIASNEDDAEIIQEALAKDEKLQEIEKQKTTKLERMNSLDTV